MPQMNKGGKFVFGKSLIRGNGVLSFPKQAADEYKIRTKAECICSQAAKVRADFALLERDFLRR